jgi:hypothetical protein
MPPTASRYRGADLRRREDVELINQVLDAEAIDEDRILARKRTLRSDLIDPTIAVHHGQVVKRTGDGAIVEFRSAVNALNLP